MPNKKRDLFKEFPFGFGLGGEPSMKIKSFIACEIIFIMGV